MGLRAGIAYSLQLHCSQVFEKSIIFNDAAASVRLYDSILLARWRTGLGSDRLRDKLNRIPQ